MNDMEKIEEKTALISAAGIENRIYTVRGVQVMIDRDLASLYEVETRTLKQAVRRNLEKFPEDFMFRLTKKESNYLISSGVSQSVIPSGYNTGGAEAFAFTEQGVAMLATVLRSRNASEMSIAIMRAFVAAVFWLPTLMCSNALILLTAGSWKPSINLMQFSIVLKTVR